MKNTAKNKLLKTSSAALMASILNVSLWGCAAAKSVSEPTKTVTEEPTKLNTQPLSAESLRIIEAVAETENDTKAMQILAETYESDLEFAKALKWYQRLAENGDAFGQYRLGQLYYYGNPLFQIKQDPLKAFELFTLSANQGYDPAEFALCTAYFRGYGVEQDYEKAFYWANKSARQGNVNAQNNLGYLYSKGLGIAKNDVQALYWYTKAAEQGSYGAQANLGDLYEKGGVGVAVDYEKSLFWNRKAAAQGSRTGLFNMGYMYENGFGVKQDKTVAKQWYNKSCEANFEEACELAKKLHNQGF